MTLKSTAMICIELEAETTDEMEELIESLSDDTKHVLPKMLAPYGWGNLWLDDVCT